MWKQEGQPYTDLSADRQVASSDSSTYYEGKGKRLLNRQNSKKKPNFLTDIEKQAELVKFTQKNLVSRRCARYAPDYTLQRHSVAKRLRQEEEFPCQCGMTYAWHVNHNYVQNDDHGDAQWNIATHAKDTITRDLGVIGFLDTCGEDHDHPRPYVRLKSDTSHKVVYELITQYWKFHTPNLVLVITGSMNLSECEQSTSRQLELALADIIKSTGAWVITDGLSGGLTKCVGNAVRECASISGQTAYEDFVLLGICSWDSVEGIESLICEEEGGNFPAVYCNVENATSSSVFQQGTSRNLQAAPNKASKYRKSLDGNHTHFIFVDGEEPSIWGREFEEYIAKKKTHIGHIEMNIPVIRLLIDSGTDTKRYSSTYFTPGVPNVIIALDDGFGESLLPAQLLTERNEKTERSRATYLTFKKTSGKRKISADDHGPTIYETEESKMVYYANFQKVSTGAALISTLREAAVEEVERARSWCDRQSSDSSMSSCEGNDALAKLMLAVFLKQPDYARYNVLSSTVDYKTLLGDSVYDLFSYFLIHNEHKFVELFIDCGIDLKKFLTLSRINFLYDQVHEQSGKDPLVKFVFDLVHRKHEKIVGDSWKKLKYVGELLRELITRDLENEYEVNGESIQESRHFSPFKTPVEQHLLLWAALFNRDHLSRTFWRCGVNHIGTALVVRKLLSKLSQNAAQQNLQDIAQHYDEQRRVFEKLAVDVLDNSFHQNPRLTIVSLTRKIPSLYGSSILAMATEAKVNSFTEHASCQLAVTRQWNGNMSPYTSWVKVLFVAIIPPFLFLVQFMRRDDREPRCDDEEYFDPGLISSMPEAATGRQNKTEFEKRSYYSVSFFKNQKSIPFFKAFWFFITAPVTKFVYHAISYTAFLIMLSIFVLTELSPNTTVISSLEYLTWIWLAGLIFEEIQQAIFSAGRTPQEKLRAHFCNLWNLYDVLMLALLLCAIVVRHTDAKAYSHTRGLYVFAETLVIIRIISVYFVTEVVGVKVLMILEMLKDVYNFLLILAVFLLSFGVAYRSLLYPEAQLNENLLFNILFKPYFILFGQIPTDEIVKGQVSGCNASIHSTIFGESDACPIPNKLAGVYLGVYCFVSNIMLINLLIASLGQTFDRMQESSKKIWQNQRYSLVHEFHHRSYLACPLNIFVVIWNIFKRCIRCSCNNEIEVKLTERGQRRIELFEKTAMESCLCKELTPNCKEEWLIDSRAALICNDDPSRNEDLHTHIVKMESRLEEAKDIWNKKTNTFTKSSKSLPHCRTCARKKTKK